jgi:hypothetical protein
MVIIDKFREKINEGISRLTGPVGQSEKSQEAIASQLFLIFIYPISKDPLPATQC